MGWMRFVPDKRGNYLIPSIVLAMGVGQEITFLRLDKWRELTTLDVETLAEDLSNNELCVWEEKSPTNDPDNRMVVIPAQEIERRYCGAMEVR